MVVYIIMWNCLVINLDTMLKEDTGVVLNWACKLTSGYQI